MTDTIVQTQKVLVQIASAVPANDSGWTSVPELLFVSGSEGAGLVLGEATLVYPYGVRTAQNDARFFSFRQSANSANPFADNIRAGMIVRLLLANGGSVSVNNIGYTPFWWGVITGGGDEPDGSTTTTGGQLIVNCVGIASVLDQIPLTAGRVKSSGVVVDPGYLPPFNAIPGGDHDGLFNHNIDPFGSGATWPAYAILGCVCSIMATKGMNLTFSDPQNTLNYIPETIDLSGATVLQAVNSLCGGARGLTWYAGLSGTAICIYIRPAVGTAFTFGTYTLAASAIQTPIDIRDQTTLSRISTEADFSQVYDIVEIIGARPWMAVTVPIVGTGAGTGIMKGSGFGWTSSLDASWATTPDTSMTENVYRRFEVSIFSSPWSGGQYNSSSVGLRNYLNPASGTTYGNAGLDGTRTFDTSKPLPTASLFRGERELPCSPGFSTLRVAARQAPVVVAGQGSAWEDVSQQWLCQVESVPFAVRLDDSDYGQTIQARLAGGDTILATVGVREIQPLRVSWNQTPANKISSFPRIKSINMPSCELWEVLAGTVTGVDASGALTTSGAVTVRDDRPQMRSALTLAVAYFSTPENRFTITSRGILDIGATLHPCAFVTYLIRTDYNQIINNVIVRRSWQLNRVRSDGSNLEHQYYDTTYAGERILPSMEAVL